MSDDRIDDEPQEADATDDAAAADEGVRVRRRRGHSPGRCARDAGGGPHGRGRADPRGQLASVLALPVAEVEALLVEARRRTTAGSVAGGRAASTCVRSRTRSTPRRRTPTVRAVRARRPDRAAHAGRAGDARGRRVPAAGDARAGVGGARGERRRRRAHPHGARAGRRVGTEPTTGAVLYGTARMRFLGRMGCPAWTRRPRSPLPAGPRRARRCRPGDRRDQVRPAGSARRQARQGVRRAWRQAGGGRPSRAGRLEKPSRTGGTERGGAGGRRHAVPCAPASPR